MPSTPDRLLALENALAEQQARRLALLVAVHAWVTANPSGQTTQTYLDFKAYLDERIADEGP